MHLHRVTRLSLTTGLLVLAWMVVAAAPAAAHTGFESSSPADGAVVDVPVPEIVVTFTGEATPAGEGFSVLDPDGVVRAPSSVSTEDDRAFVLRFDPPLAGGTVGVRWMVQAQDAHPIDGSFSFTVTAPVSTAPPDTTTPAAVAPPTTPLRDGRTPTTSAAPTTSTPATTAVPVAPAAGPVSGGGPSLDQFLDADSPGQGDGLQLVGRILSFLGVIGALGGLAFMASTLRGSPREIDAGLAAVGVLGAVLSVGGLVEYAGLVAGSDRSFWDAGTSTPGVAMALRFLGGVAIAAGVAMRGTRPTSRPARALSAGVIQQESAAGSATALERWSPRRAPLALVGSGLAIASFWFDGHTVSEGPRLVHAAAASVHVVAAAVWAGGVVALAVTVWSRRRGRRPTRAAELIVRFSAIASASLAAVVVAGVLMAVFMLDSPGELTSTEWGKILCIKTAAVTLAALVGAYNHFRLRPALEAAPDDPELEADFARTLVVEAVLLTFVVVVTAWLVAAAT